MDHFWSQVFQVRATQPIVFTLKQSQACREVGSIVQIAVFALESEVFPCVCYRPGHCLTSSGRELLPPEPQPSLRCHQVSQCCPRERKRPVQSHLCLVIPVCSAPELGTALTLGLWTLTEALLTFGTLPLLKRTGAVLCSVPRGVVWCVFL